jgi:N utilization substance protein A
VDIDMSVLRSLEREKDISFDLVVKAIEDALLIAYFRTDGAGAKARAELDKSSGHVTIWAAELDEDGEIVREYDDTPGNFSRIAATTAKQVILQQLRDAEDEINFGEFASREGELVSGVIQQGKDPRVVLVDLGKIEAVLPAHEQVPGEDYVHGERLRAYVVQVKKGHKGPSVTLSRTHPGLVKKLFALEVPEIADGTVEIAAVAREAGHRTKIAVRSRRPGVNPKGACIGPMGSRVRNVMTELHGEKIDIIDWSEDPGEFVGNALSPARVSHVEVLDLEGRVARLPALPGHRQGRAECPACRPVDGLAHRHPPGYSGRGRRRFRRCVDTVSWNMVATRPHSAPVWAAGSARLSPSCSGWCGSRIKWSLTCKDGFLAGVHRCIRP